MGHRDWKNKRHKSTAEIATLRRIQRREEAKKQEAMQRRKGKR